MSVSLRRTALLLASTALALPLSWAGAGIATAADGNGDQVSWAVRTAPNDFGTDRQNYVYTLDPGQSLQDGLVVTNHGQEPLDLVVSAEDGFTNEAGQLDLLPAAEDSAEVGLWVQPAEDHVSIPAGKSVEVPFTVTVPDNATPGDHMGGIITSLTQVDSQQQINVDRRLAIRIRLRVGGELAPALAVEKVHLDYSGTANPLDQGTGTLTYTIHNTGNAILTARQDTDVHGPFDRFGAGTGKLEDTPELLPGESWDVSVPVEHLTPAFRLSGVVTVTPLLVDASGSTTALDPVTAETKAWAMPWTLMVVVVVLLLLAAALVVQRGRRRRTAQEREEARVQEAVAEALREREGSSL